MSPQLRQTLFTAGCIALAAWMGWLIADGAYALPLLVLVVTGSAVLVRLFHLALDVIFLGLILVGYIVGNRGFAQLMPVPNLPLLPAEMALLLCGGWLLVQCAFARRLPVARDWLNRIILVWLVVGTGRLGFDLPRHGFNAVRDYAMIYYAGFFFVAQHLAAEARHRRYLMACLVVAALLLPPLFTLSTRYPEFFFSTLTVRGVPLIYYKGDLAATFMAGGALVLFFTLPGRHRYWSWPVATALFVFASGGNNRAAMLGSLIVLLWLAAARRWVFPVLQLSAGMAALCLLIGLAVATDNDWADRKLDGLRDRALSLVDVTGRMAYQSAESGNKGDNNRFRLVWWRTVVEDTWNQNPVLGLGFGYDLARDFVQEYSPDITEEFTTRAPHSILVSAFGRMGTVGLAIFVAFGAIMARCTWRALQSADEGTVGLWMAAWLILVSACFGVVLEGPMGAVVFWSILGLAHGSPPAAPAEPDLAVS